MDNVNEKLTKTIVKGIQYRLTPMDSEHSKINIDRTFHRDDYKSLDAVIDSLEECDKLKKMWASFADLYEQFMIPVEGDRTLIKKLMVDLEIDNGYFPKEGK